MKEHALKTWPASFQAVLTGQKTCEIRRCDDRMFRAGDVLLLIEYEPTEHKETGRRLRALVTDITVSAGGRLLTLYSVCNTTDGAREGDRIDCAAMSIRLIDAFNTVIRNVH